MAENQQLSSDLEKFLEDNDVKKGWKELILKNEDLKKHLQDAVDFSNEKNSVPSNNQYLKAFSYAEPENIKVVIFGTSPALSVGNHLAFTGDPEESPAVKKFNAAAKEAGIVEIESYKNHDKDHTVWAENGVLLVNAALSMSRTEGADIIEEHIKVWLPFMEGLFSAWLKWFIDNHCRKYEDHPLIVITLGHQWISKKNHVYKNYADELWSNVLKNTKVSDNKNIQTYKCQHPTCPNEDYEENNFSTKMPTFFKKILEKHKTIFKTGENADQKDLVEGVGRIKVTE